MLGRKYCIEMIFEKSRERLLMVQHKKLLEWVEEMAALLEPDSIHWCDGSEEENKRLLEENVAKGAAVRLNHEKRP
jgi:phosphoenolpyruvate carboxykinase (GTP)